VTEVLFDRSGRAAADRLQLVGMVVVSLFFAIIPARAIRHAPADLASWLLVGILGAASLLAAAVAARQYFGHERVLLEDGRLRVIRKLGPFRKDASIPLQEIAAVEVPHSNEAFVPTRWGVRPPVVVRTAVGSLLCGEGASPREAERLAARIRSHVPREGREAVEQKDAADEAG
jgi:hypothetical protein